MTSQVEIYNMALGNIGISETVASLEERSKAQYTCTRYWEIARDTALSEFSWSFATKTATLALVGTPPRGWIYQYQYPTDCLKAMALTPAGRVWRPQSIRERQNFKIGFADESQVILANDQFAELSYVVRISDTGRYPPLFVEALSWKLAMHIATPMTAQTSVVQNAAAAYERAWQLAASADLNESTEDILGISCDYITGRC
jgi:hypothetical protein